MNPPIVFFYVTPRPAYTLEKVYKPPQNECDYIIKLNAAGYPTSIFEAKCPSSTVKQLKSCILLFRGWDRLVTKDEFIDQDVFALVWWNKELCEKDLSMAITCFTKVFDLQSTKSGIVTRSMSRMLDKGFICPPESQEYLGGTFEDSGGENSMDISE